MKEKMTFKELMALATKLASMTDKYEIAEIILDLDRDSYVQGLDNMSAIATAVIRGEND